MRSVAAKEKSNAHIAPGGIHHFWRDIVTMARGGLAMVLLLTISGQTVQGQTPPAETPRTPIEVPPENRAGAEPPRPPIGDFAERAAELFTAILNNDVAAAERLFFPRDAFRRVKAVGNPDRIYNRLIRELHQHVRALHAEIPATATFDRFERSRRCSWVERRQEANALPYWSCRHNWLYYRVGDEERRFKIRTLITWGTTWYITHLAEFRH